MTTVYRELHDLLDVGAEYEIASRAANLTEQIRIAQVLSHQESSLTSECELTGVDVWRLQRLARKLAVPRIGSLRGAAAQRSADELEQILMVNRLLALRSGSLGSQERALLDDVHSAWLPTYTAAVHGFDPSALRMDEEDWFGVTETRRWVALACAPFLLLLHHEAEAAIAAADRTTGRRLFGHGVIEAFGKHLINRFMLSLAWAIEADQNVAFARLGIGKDGATDVEHRDYFDRVFRDAFAYHRFYLRFPVLVRWLATVTHLLCGSARSIVERLCRDADEIGARLFGEPIIQFTSLNFGKGDYHAGGHSVAFVDVVLASGPESFVYKPRCLRSEAAMQGLLEHLTAEGVIGFAPHRVMVRDGYGYEQRIPSGRNHVRSRGDAARIYNELGGFLGIFYVLGGSDLHYENVMVADGHAFVFDCETALRVAPLGQEPAAGTVMDSVYRTGLLEWPRLATADAVLRLSGYAGGESYELAAAVPRLQEGPTLAVRYETGVRIEPDAPNRVRFNGEVLEPRDFQDAIIHGFSQVYQWFQHHAARAIGLVEKIFSAASVRFVARASQTYSQLLIASRHPRCLTEPLEVDLVFDKLSDNPLSWDTSGLALASELRSLWQLDIPLFSTRAASADLVHDHRDVIAVKLPRSPLRHAADRIGGLGSEDRRQQVGYISASLSIAEIHSRLFVATSLEYSRLVAHELYRLLEDPSQPVSWRYEATGAELERIQHSLYYGSAGVALFLAYLDSIEPDEKLRWAAERAMAHALSCDPVGIGAFQGQAGLVYVLTHLHHLWGGSSWLEFAVDRSRRLAEMIDEDRAFDIMTGSAGVIPVMLGLATVSGEGIDTAHRCARHLLRHAERTQTNLSWPPEDKGSVVANFTGFAHGTAGIGWALIALGVATGREEYVDAGKLAFTYEAAHFDHERQDWYDLRTTMLQMTKGRRHFANAWCNGAAGISLSRLESWAALGKNDEQLLREAYLGLSATLRNFSGIANDTYCHGRSGNAELFLRFSRVRNEPAFQLEANMQAQAQWRRIAALPDWPRTDDGHVTLPGLMVGITGIGMHFLRLAYPDQIPSPLLLDPPQSSQ